jgi:hypothetical protein
MRAFVVTYRNTHGGMAMELVMAGPVHIDRIYSVKEEAELRVKELEEYLGALCKIEERPFD